MCIYHTAVELIVMIFWRTWAKWNNYVRSCNAQIFVLWGLQCWGHKYVWWFVRRLLYGKWFYHFWLCSTTAGYIHIRQWCTQHNFLDRPFCLILFSASSNVQYGCANRVHTFWSSGCGSQHSVLPSWTWCSRVFKGNLLCFTHFKGVFLRDWHNTYNLKSLQLMFSWIHPLSHNSLHMTFIKQTKQNGIMKCL